MNTIVKSSIVDNPFMEKELAANENAITATAMPLGMFNPMNIFSLVV